MSYAELNEHLLLSYLPNERQALARGYFFARESLQINRYRQYAYQPENSRDRFWDFENGSTILDFDKFIKNEVLGSEIIEADLTRALSHIVIGLKGLYFQTDGNFLFRFLLGNNFPKLQLESPTDSHFTHSSPRDNILNFAILGPDDYGLTSRFAREPRRLSMYQVLHSQLTRDPDSKFHMPASYYALFSKQLNTVFVCLDSTTFLFDRVQQSWLLTLYRLFVQIDPTVKFILVLYHSLRHEMPTHRNISHNDEMKMAPLWQKCQMRHSQLTLVPEIIVQRDEVAHETWTCNPESAFLGLNSTIGNGIKTFLLANNIYISAAITRGEQQYDPVNAEEWSFVKKRGEPEEQYLTYADGQIRVLVEIKVCNFGEVHLSKNLLWSKVDTFSATQLARHLKFGPLHRNDIDRLNVDNGFNHVADIEQQPVSVVVVDPLLQWVCLRASENLSNSHGVTENEPDVSLLSDPTKVLLTSKAAHDPSSASFSSELYKLINGGRLAQSYKHFAHYLQDKVKRRVPLRNCLTAAMLLDPRYNPALLLLALIKFELQKRNVYIVSMSPKFTEVTVSKDWQMRNASLHPYLQDDYAVYESSPTVWSSAFYVGYTDRKLVKSPRRALAITGINENYGTIRLAISVDQLYQSHVGFIEPTKDANGKFNSCLSLDIEFKVDWWRGIFSLQKSNMTGCQLVMDILGGLGVLKLVGQQQILQSLQNDYLCTADAPQRSIDLLGNHRRVTIPFKKILPHATTQFLAQRVNLYHSDPFFRTRIDEQCVHDIGRIVTLGDNSINFENIDQLLENAGAEFLKDPHYRDELTLLKLLLVQNADFSPLSGFCKLWLERLREDLAVEVSYHRESPACKPILFIADNTQKKCWLICRENYNTLIIDGENQNKPYPILQCIIILNLTLNPSEFVRDAYFLISDEVEKMLAAKGKHNVFEAVCRKLSEETDGKRQYSYANNARLLHVEELDLANGNVYYMPTLSDRIQAPNLPRSLRIDAPITKILPHTEPNFFSSFINLYRDNQAYKADVDGSIANDLRRGIRIPNNRQVPEDFEQLIQLSGAQSLMPEDSSSCVLLRLLVMQKLETNPFAAFWALITKLCKETYAVEIVGVVVDEGSTFFYANQITGRHTITYHRKYRTIKIGDYDHTFEHPVIECAMTVHLTLDTRFFFQDAHIIVKPAAREFLRRNRREDVLEKVVNYLSHNKSNNLKIIGVGQQANGIFRLLEAEEMG
jgi:hypothetical protein